MNGRSEIFVRGAFIRLGQVEVTAHEDGGLIITCGQQRIILDRAQADVVATILGMISR